jgi:uncharacterized RDD family membrane protein YckC
MTSAPSSPIPYAGAVSRLGAYLLDLAAMATLAAGGSAVVAFLVEVVTGRHLELSGDRDLAGVGLAMVWLAYLAGSWAATGSTPGMAVFGLRVVQRDGRPASVVAALLRALAFPLSVALLGLGFLGIVYHPERRALHDLIAATVVVYTADVHPAGR